MIKVTIVQDAVVRNTVVQKWITYSSGMSYSIGRALCLERGLFESVDRAGGPCLEIGYSKEISGGGCKMLNVYINRAGLCNRAAGNCYLRNE